LGILGLILISVIFGIWDHLSSDCFWAHPWCEDVGVAGWGGCLLPVN